MLNNEEFRAGRPLRISGPTYPDIATLQRFKASYKLSAKIGSTAISGWLYFFPSEILTLGQAGLESRPGSCLLHIVGYYWNFTGAVIEINTI
jgi:hypothetical protein